MPHDTSVITADGRTNADTRARYDSSRTASSSRFRSSSGTSSSALAVEPQQVRRHEGVPLAARERLDRHGLDPRLGQLVVPAVDERVVLDAGPEQPRHEDRRPLDLRRSRGTPPRRSAARPSSRAPRSTASIGGEPVEQRLEHLLRDGDLLAVAIEAPPGPRSGRRRRARRPSPARRARRGCRAAARRPGRWGRQAAATWVKPRRRPWRGCYSGDAIGLYDRHRRPRSSRALQLE